MISEVLKQTAVDAIADHLITKAKQHKIPFEMDRSFAQNVAEGIVNALASSIEEFALTREYTQEQLDKILAEYKTKNQTQAQDVPDYDISKEE